MHDEHAMLMAAACAAAWSDGDLVPAEKAQVLALAGLLKIEDMTEVETLLASPEKAAALLAEPPGEELALRLFAIALNLTLADQNFLEVEEYFLRKLAARFALPEDAVEGAIKLARGEA